MSVRATERVVRASSRAPRCSSSRATRWLSVDLGTRSNTFNDLPAHDEVEAQYAALARGLRGLRYVHVVVNPHPGFAATLGAMRAGFGGPLILNGGFDAARAGAALAAGDADLISFGRPFIANPDLVARLRRGAALAVPEPATFYTPGPEGYVDYAVAG